MTVARFDGRPVAVTGGSQYDLFLHTGVADMHGSAVRLWDLRTGRKVGKTMAVPDFATGGRICSLEVVASERGPVAVVASEYSAMQAWGLTRNELLTYVKTASTNGVMGTATLEGRPVAVTGGAEAALEVWDVLAGERIGGPLTGFEPATRAVAITQLNGRAVVVAGGDDEKLRIWELASGEPVGRPMTAHASTIDTLATAHVGGRVIAVTGGRDDTTRVWDLARGEQIGEPLKGHACLAVAEIDGQPVAVTGHHGTAVRVWDLTFAGPDRGR